MQRSEIVCKLQIYAKKKIEDYKRGLLSRNQSLANYSLLGIMATAVSCGLIAIGLIVGAIVKRVRSSKNNEKEEEEKKGIGNSAMQQEIDLKKNECEVNKELTTQTVNFFKSVQNTQDVMNNLNTLNNMDIGLKI